MSNYPKISIIVPVYNVGHYIEKCVSSVLQQSFTEYELLLVDDGSTDGSGELCEMLAKNEARVRCFHKQNGGLSDARNFGIARATSEFITFVDSDDWLEQDYLKYLYKNALDDNVDISTCVFQYIDEKGARPWKSISSNPVLMSGREALLSLLYDEKVNVSAVGKLYRSFLFKGIQYPVGKRYEDVGTTYKLLARARSVSVGGAPLYNYRMRAGSITHTDSEGVFDRLDLAKQAYVALQDSDEDIRSAAERYLVFHSLSVLHLCDLSEPSQRAQAIDIRKDVLRRSSRILSNPRVPKRDKAAIWALRAGLNGYRIAWEVYASATGR